MKPYGCGKWAYFKLDRKRSEKQAKKKIRRMGKMEITYQTNPDFDEAVAKEKARRQEKEMEPKPEPLRYVESEDDAILRKAREITERRAKEAKELQAAKDKAYVESLVGQVVTFVETKDVVYGEYLYSHTPKLDEDFLTPLAELYNALPLGTEIEITVKVLKLKV
jgi:hypothetical protein